MTKNELIMLIIIETIIDKSKKYIEADFVEFPGKEIGYVKKACTYFQKILDEYGKRNVTREDIRTAINRIHRQVRKLPLADEVSKIPAEDFEYLVIMDLANMQISEIIENQKAITATAKTNLKIANTYINKFLGYVEQVLE